MAEALLYETKGAYVWNACDPQKPVRSSENAVEILGFIFLIVVWYVVARLEPWLGTRGRRVMQYM